MPLNRYLDELERTGNSLMVYSGGRLIFQSGSKGIRPHLEAIDSLGEKLHGSIMVDKIVGRAAALLILYSGAAEAHAALISTPGRQVLEQHGLRFSYAKETPHIKMLDGRIYCPFEAMVQGLSDPGEAYRAIVEKMAALKEKK
ncbi:MAG TPA: DUF1893 domain-containing protein [Candidatus Bathyarchaeia archaeon]